ncbi:HET and ankyrin domain protein [Colletotrichum plurivorum]|uniref:HET and ankyrin domain protein n=1 Tax=Colletotrichum plurivorum TaxID=2175906 RepID=A0A8H6N972_9PEZI|nr:HET and ankyrin domain protein [Colletotrichum plurivorum]
MNHAIEKTAYLEAWLAAVDKWFEQPSPPDGFVDWNSSPKMQTTPESPVVSPRTVPRSMPTEPAALNLSPKTPSEDQPASALSEGDQRSGNDRSDIVDLTDDTIQRQRHSANMHTKRNSGKKERSLCIAPARKGVSPEADQVHDTSPLPTDDELDSPMMDQASETIEQSTPPSSPPRRFPVKPVVPTDGPRQRLFSTKPAGSPAVVINELKKPAAFHGPSAGAPAWSDSGYASDPSSYRSSEKSSENFSSTGRPRPIVRQPSVGVRGRNTYDRPVVLPVGPPAAPPAASPMLLSTGSHSQYQYRRRVVRLPNDHSSEINTSSSMSVPFPRRPSVSASQAPWSPWAPASQSHPDYLPLIRGDGERPRRRPSVSSYVHNSGLLAAPISPSTMSPRSMARNGKMVADGSIPSRRPSYYPDVQFNRGEATIPVARSPHRRPSSSINSTYTCKDGNMVPQRSMPSLPPSHYSNEMENFRSGADVMAKSWSKDKKIVPERPIPPTPRSDYSDAVYYSHVVRDFDSGADDTTKSSLEDIKAVTGRVGALSIDSSSAADHKRLSDMVFRDREDMDWLENDMEVYIAPEMVFSNDGEYLPDQFPTGYFSSEVSSTLGKAENGVPYRMEIDDTWALRQATFAGYHDVPDRSQRRGPRRRTQQLKNSGTQSRPQAQAKPLAARPVQKIYQYHFTYPQMPPQLFKSATDPQRFGGISSTESIPEKVKLQEKINLLEKRDLCGRKPARKQKKSHDLDTKEIVLQQAITDSKDPPPSDDGMGEEPILEGPAKRTNQSLRRSCSAHSIESRVSHESGRSGETESSFADSLWLLSEHSNEPEVLGEDHPFFPLKPLALQKVLDGFRAWQECPKGPNNSSSTTTSSKASDNNQSSGSSKKRPRKSGSEESPDNGEIDPSKDQKTASKRQKTSEKKLTFACPFSKKDPMKHRDCYKYTLNRIRDIKQHLVRCHRVPLYCPRCMDTFPNEEGRDNHIRDVDCPKRQFIKLDGVTDSQRSQLSKKVPSNISKEDQWFGVFDILFPNHPRPGSPYIDNDLLQDITLYQDYLSNHGPRILSDILTSRGAVTWNLPNEERDLAAFQQSIFEEGLRAIFEQWASQNGISVPEPTVQSTSVSLDHLTPADGDDRSTQPTDNPRASSIFTDDRQLHDATSLTDQLTVPSELDLAHLGANLGDSEDMWAEDFNTPQLDSLTTEEETQLMRMMANGEPEQPYSSWAWRFFQ